MVGVPSVGVVLVGVVGVVSVGVVGVPSAAEQDGLSPLQVPSLWQVLVLSPMRV